MKAEEVARLVALEEEHAAEYRGALGIQDKAIKRLKAEVKTLESACDRWVEAEKEWEMTKGVLEAAIEAKDEVHEEQLATAQAQAAVMAGLMAWVHDEGAGITSNAIGQWCVMCDWFDESYDAAPKHDADCFILQARAALSAAPEVVWWGPIQVDTDSEGLPILVPIDDMGPLESLADREFEVIVLDKQGEGE